MNVLSFAVTRFIYFSILSVLVTPFGWWALHILKALEGTSVESLLRLCLLLALLAWFAAAGWLADRAATRRVFHGEDFGEGLHHAFGEARLYLGYLPVIGRLFAYKRKD